MIACPSAFSCRINSNSLTTSWRQGCSSARRAGSSRSNRERRPISTIAAPQPTASIPGARGSMSDGRAARAPAPRSPASRSWHRPRRVGSTPSSMFSAKDRRRERQLLIDHRDARLARVEAARLFVRGAPARDIGPASCLQKRRQDAYEGALAGPFWPTRRTLACATPAPNRSRATVPPKTFLIRGLRIISTGRARAAPSSPVGPSCRA